MNFAFKTSKQKVYVSSLFMFAWEFLPMLCLKKSTFPVPFWNTLFCVNWVPHWKHTIKYQESALLKQTIRTILTRA